MNTWARNSCDCRRVLFAHCVAAGCILCEDLTARGGCGKTLRVIILFFVLVILLNSTFTLMDFRNTPIVLDFGPPIARKSTISIRYRFLPKNEQSCGKTIFQPFIQFASIAFPLNYLSFLGQKIDWSSQESITYHFWAKKSIGRGISSL